MESDNNAIVMFQLKTSTMNCIQDAIYAISQPKINNNSQKDSYGRVLLIFCNMKLHAYFNDCLMSFVSVHRM